MDAPNAPYLRLDGRTRLEPGAPVGWSGGHLNALTGPVGSGLRLTALALGRLALDSPHDSLGGLRLPPVLALDGDARVYLLDRVRARILRYSARQGRFLPLPTIGGRGGEPRQLLEPQAIAAVDRRLYVAEPGGPGRGGRVQVFETRTLALVHLFTARDDRGEGGTPWQPVDLVAHGGAVYALDAANARVWRHHPNAEGLEFVLTLGGDGDVRFDRLLVTRAGRILARTWVAPGVPELRSPAPADDQALTISQPDQIRHEVDPPQLLLDEHDRFCLPAVLAAPCPSLAPAAALARPLGRCAPFAEGGQVFDLAGRPQPVAPDDGWGSPLFERTGHWLSPALDGRRLGQRWHRLVFELAQFPPGASLELRTRTADEEGAIDPRALASSSWDRGGGIVAPAQPQPGEARAQVHEAFVQSPPGRYLWLRIDLAGDGFATPVLTALEVAYGGDTWLDFLPAVFREDPEGRRFLERYLAALQAEWDGLAAGIDGLARILDPRTAPAPFLDYLASWLDLTLEQRLDTAAKRRLLEVVRVSLRGRGTIQAFRTHLQAYLAAITGREPAALLGFPHILEGFRERRWLHLAEPGARLGEATPLWSEDRIGRVRLGAPIREAGARIVSRGEPWRDVFDAHADRFRVFVPAVWLADDDDAAMLQRAIEREKPAHARYQLHLVRPGVIVGRKANLGLDTILGDRRPLRLVCEHGRRARLRATAPRLGIEALVACAHPAPGGVRLERRLTLGKRQVVL